jgi:4-amino-4-deoxy-L-arabinose transferase-like glycosyltransferase
VGALYLGVYSHWLLAVYFIILLSGISVALTGDIKGRLSVWRELRQVYNRSDLICAGALLLLGAIALFPYLGSHPPVGLGDEGIFFEHAIQTSQNWQGNALGSGTYSYPALGRYYQAIFIELFGVSRWSWRLSSAVASVAAIPIFYLLFRMTLAIPYAFFATIVTLGSPYFLAVSRMGYYSNHTIPIVAAFMLTMALSIRFSDMRLLFVAGMLSGLGFLSYPPAKVSLVVGLLYLILARMWPGEGARTRLSHLGLFLIANLVAILPHLAAAAYQGGDTAAYKLCESIFLNTWSLREIFRDVPVDSVWKMKCGEHELFFDMKLASILILRGIFRSLLIFHRHDVISQQYMVTGMVGYFAPLFLIAGLGFVTARIRQPQYRLLLLLFISCLTCLSALNTGGDRHSHLLPIVPVAGIFVFYGVAIATALVGSFQRWIMVTLTGCISATIALYGIYTYYVLILTTYPATLDSAMALEITDSYERVPIWYVASAIDKYPSNDHLPSGAGGRWAPWASGSLRMQDRFAQIPLEDLSNAITRGKPPYIIYTLPHRVEEVEHVLASFGKHLADKREIQGKLGLKHSTTLGFRLVFK